MVLMVGYGITLAAAGKAGTQKYIVNFSVISSFFPDFSSPAFRPHPEGEPKSGRGYRLSPCSDTMGHDLGPRPIVAGGAGRAHQVRPSQPAGQLRTGFQLPDQSGTPVEPAGIMEPQQPALLGHPEPPAGRGGVGRLSAAIGEERGQTRGCWRLGRDRRQAAKFIQFPGVGQGVGIGVWQQGRRAQRLTHHRSLSRMEDAVDRLAGQIERLQELIPVIENDQFPVQRGASLPRFGGNHPGRGRIIDPSAGPAAEPRQGPARCHLRQGERSARIAGHVEADDFDRPIGARRFQLGGDGL